MSHSTTLIVGPQVFHFPSDLCAYARVAFDKQLAIKFGSITHAAEVRLLVGQTRPIASATVPALQNIADPTYDDRYLARETKVDKTRPRGQPRPSVQPRRRRSVSLSVCLTSVFLITGQINKVSCRKQIARQHSSTTNGMCTRSETEMCKNASAPSYRLGSMRTCTKSTLI